MLDRLKDSGLVLPALFAAAGLAVLIGLGTWQLERRASKLDLISRLEARTLADPIPLARALEIWRRTGEVEYLRLRVKGRFHHDRESFLYMPAAEGPGYHVYTPLETAEAQLVLVNRGFVPAELKAAERRRAGQLDGEVEVTGLARQPTGKGWFTPASDVEHNIYFWPDYPTMLAAATAAGKGELSPVPFFLDAERAPQNPGGWPRGGVTRLELPNRHLEYAITWYGLAAALSAVFAAFARGRLRSAPG